jgi:hypothetical protein
MIIWRVPESTRPEILLILKDKVETTKDCLAVEGATRSFGGLSREVRVL